MVMMDMRYMWSEMLSPEWMQKRSQPARLVVLRRSRRWKKGIGVVGGEEGGGRPSSERAAWCIVSRG